MGPSAKGTPASDPAPRPPPHPPCDVPQRTASHPWIKRDIDTRQQKVDILRTRESSITDSRDRSHPTLMTVLGWVDAHRQGTMIQRAGVVTHIHPPPPPLTLHRTHQPHPSGYPLSL